jgi:dihydrofolate reductase
MASSPGQTTISAACSAGTAAATPSFRWPARTWFSGYRRPARIICAWSRIGALVTGRHDFDVSGAWGGQPLQGWHTFIVTHNPPAEWTQPGSPFHFVTDGVESAIAQAQQAADGKDVAVGGTTIVQQALRAGLIDEISIELVPMLLGSGTRLFDHLEMHPTDLEIVRVIPTRDVTHLHYRVVKQPAG